MQETRPIQPLEADEERLLSRVAWYYYNDGLTQEEVGRRLKLSRIKVSRLLEKGRRLGVIQVQINSRFRPCFSLEGDLAGRYSLQDVLVVPEMERGSTNERLAQAAAHYLERQVKDGDFLAVGWGDTVTRTLKIFSRVLSERSVSIVSLAGGVASYLEGWGHVQLNNEGHIGSRLHLIPSPILASSVEMARALRNEPQVKAIIAMAKTANHALVGIGPPSEQATLAFQGYVSPAELQLYRRTGAVGDILGQFFDANGVLLDLEIRDRIIGMRLEELRQIPTVIGVAGGAHKVDAILGALAGRYLNVLITDEPTARSLLREPSAEERGT